MAEEQLPVIACLAFKHCKLAYHTSHTHPLQRDFMARKTPVKAVSRSAIHEVTSVGAIASCPIVRIGASAGGLEAFEAFFRAWPVDSGMAFMLVPHLDSSHVSLLTTSWP